MRIVPTTGISKEFQRLSIDKAIRASQRCQRNWDLTQVINEDDVKVLETAVTQCASKQNDVYYKVKFITDRDTIESIHEQTKGFTMEADDGEIVKVEIQGNNINPFLKNLRENQNSNDFAYFYGNDGLVEVIEENNIFKLSFF